MIKQVITTLQAPQAVGAYSQAVKVGNVVYLSGQIPLDPKTMQLVLNDFDAEVRQVFANLHAVAEAAGGDLAAIVKLTVYLTDMQDYARVNQIMEEEWPRPFPARAVIGVNSLPKGARVEADAVLHLSL
jgi:reactive intermediate/imine deaminase